MALIKCPECGYENVSNSTELCPNCGYDIRMYLDVLQIEKEQMRLAQSKKDDAYYQQVQAEVEKNRDAKRKQLDALPEPSKPNAIIIVLGVCFVILSLLLVFLEFVFWGIIIGLIGIAGIIVGRNQYKEDKRIYELSLKDMDTAKMQAYTLKKNNDMALERQNEEIINALNPFKSITNGYVCPMCGKKSGKKISTANRAASVAMLGLSSAKIGKQYKCTSCGHMW